MTDTPLRPDDILRTAETLRRQIGGNFHERLIEDIYADAARLADRAVTRPDAPPRCHATANCRWRDCRRRA